MDLICKQPIPYKSLDFITQFHYIYFNYSVTTKINLFSPLLSLLFFKIIHYLAFYLTGPAKSVFWQLIFNDFIYLANLPVEVNMLVIANFFLAAYYLYLHYFQQHFAMKIVSEIFSKQKQTDT